MFTIVKCFPLHGFSVHHVGEEHHLAAWEQACLQCIVAALYGPDGQLVDAFHDPAQFPHDQHPVPAVRQ